VASGIVLFGILFGAVGLVLKWETDKYFKDIGSEVLNGE